MLHPLDIGPLHAMISALVSLGQEVSTATVTAYRGRAHYGLTLQNPDRTWDGEAVDIWWHIDQIASERRR